MQGRNFFRKTHRRSVGGAKSFHWIRYCIIILSFVLLIYIYSPFSISLIQKPRSVIPPCQENDLLQKEQEEIWQLQAHIHDLHQIIKNLIPYASLQENILEQVDERLKIRLQSSGLARVVWIDLEEGGHHLWLDRGSQTGVQSGDVVCMGRTAVGYIDKVLSHRARVHLISDPNLHMAITNLPWSQRNYYQYDADRLVEFLKYEQQYDLAHEVHAYFYAKENKELHFTSSIEIQGLVQGDQLNCRRQPVHLKGTDLELTNPRLDIPITEQDLSALLGTYLWTSGLDKNFPPGLEIGLIQAVWLSVDGRMGLKAISNVQITKGQFLLILKQD